MESERFGERAPSIAHTRSWEFFFQPPANRGYSIRGHKRVFYEQVTGVKGLFFHP